MAVFEITPAISLFEFSGIVEVKLDQEAQESCVKANEPMKAAGRISLMCF